MASPTAQILIASSEDDLAPLVPLLSQQGYQVKYDGDSARVLERALKAPPALILVDTRLRGLTASRFGQLLRGNSRTEGIPVFYVGEEGENVEGFRRHKDRFVPRPFNTEQLLADIHAFFRRAGQVRQVSRKKTDFEGSLSRLSLVDLLQVLSLNQKEGVLTLTRPQGKGTIYLLDGCVIHAHTCQVSGEKAFHRMLTWDEGLFAFSPTHVDVEASIHLPMDHLLMEGLRQNDELMQQRNALPAPDLLLRLNVPRQQVPEDLRPVTREILDLLAYYPRCGDLVEHCSRPDYEVLQVLKDLLDRGLVKVRAATVSKTTSQPLLSSEDILAVRNRLVPIDALPERASGKLILLARSQKRVVTFLQALQGLEEFEARREFLDMSEGLPLGDAGRLNLNEVFYLRLFALPSLASAAPLWQSFSSRLFGVIVLDGKEGFAEAERFFTERFGVQVLSFDSAALTDNRRQGLLRCLQQLAAPFRQSLEKDKP
ncbi:DUF4388 domain-containing protein [Desulfuromonas sp. KJ2020]|uniref:DUF4388 domain-containing protein n=1 Tax=Desulfuromonas sp. KJ2020 TaxID=2919173 RepID=UPI0020A7E26B|nr:DUF4388 domain-containing protein [Desulfuromonas sp. KJ2020]MCP3177473.1 DUF4388 domain-containing protein [Desulfuromonas sp. KJ2020]